MFRTEVAQPLDEAGQKRAWILVATLCGVLIGCYGNMLWGTWEAWGEDMYQHGWIIPIGAAFLIWYRREPWLTVSMRDRWWGAGLIIFGTALRLWGSRRVEFTLDRLSFVVCLLGVFTLVGGWRALRWAGPAIVFLVLMYPWPRVMVDRILRPLKTLATISSVYTLQTLGIETYRDGNVINLQSHQMGVVDQCSGLRMLTIFLGLSFFMAMIMRERPLWERIVVVVSAVPIAMITNVFRISLTGVLYTLEFQEEFWNKVAGHVFHDFAGLLMMPLAIVLLLVETKILSHVVIEEKPPPVLASRIGQP